MTTQNKVTQLHNTTPEELTQNILNGVKEQLNVFSETLNNPKKETYLTRIKTAEMLSISLTCLNDWSNKGILRAKKLGNRTYFKLSDIEKRLEQSNTL